MICPRCGLEQSDGLECRRCGIVFAKYRSPVFPAEPPLAPEPAGAGVPPLPEIYPESPLPPRRPTVSRPLRPFDSGPLLGETFAIYFAHFLPFLVLTALAFSPILLPVFVLGASPAMEVWATLGSLLCSPLATAAVTYGVFQHMRRREITTADCLRMGVSFLLPLLFLALLQGLLVGLATLACIVPGIILAASYAVAVPAAVEERPGILAALRRSQELTSGYRWQVFGVLFIVGLLGVGLAFLVTPLLGILGSAGQGPRVVLLASQLLNLVPTGIAATASAVMYYRLRSLKESIDVDEIASVFD